MSRGRRPAGLAGLRRSRGGGVVREGAGPAVQGFVGPRRTWASTPREMGS